MSQVKEQKIWLKCKQELFDSTNLSANNVESVVTVPSFQLDDSWPLFFKRLEDYFTEQNVKSDRRASVLLTCISEPVYAVLKKLCRPELPTKKTFKQLISLLSNYFVVKNPWRERIIFHKLKQSQENVTEWYNRVQLAASNCEFGSLLDEHIKIKFICGMRSGPVLDRLCEEETNKSSSDFLHVAVVKESESSLLCSPSETGNENESSPLPRYPSRKSPREPLKNKENQLKTVFRYADQTYSSHSSHCKTYNSDSLCLSVSYDCMLLQTA